MFNIVCVYYYDSLICQFLSIKQVTLQYLNLLYLYIFSRTNYGLKRSIKYTLDAYWLVYIVVVAMKASLKTHRSVLRSTLKGQYGLLAELDSNWLLSDEQLDDIKTERTMFTFQASEDKLLGAIVQLTGVTKFDEVLKAVRSMRKSQKAKNRFKAKNRGKFSTLFPRYVAYGLTYTTKSIAFQKKYLLILLICCLFLFIKFIFFISIAYGASDCLQSSGCSVQYTPPWLYRFS